MHKIWGTTYQHENKVICTQKPNELWEIDLIGRITDEEKKNKFIFAAIDHHSKCIETRVLNNKPGIEIIKVIKELIINKHGIPERIMSDHGSEFLIKEIQSLKMKYGIA
ncbi:Gag-Pol polyprotein [Nosema granulosis]|uniref:Gag-Pol polyprotein n=1 Tax=Nosema granulosis TaxID=83296 RepID=A0A9P6KYE8_9MICR|nr:Gag-Pol polyprotein [Nosema granulosis]